MDSPTEIRPPAVAGTFYPADPGELRLAVERYLEGAPGTTAAAPKAVIVPHAGYVYSGPVAATAYAAIGPLRDRVSRVVLLGPCHHVAVRGVATSSADAFRTPLGDVPVDREPLRDLPLVTVFDATHEHEHSLEVHLPFLQYVLGQFSVLPLVVGDADPEEVAAVLDALWGGMETLVVVSSDLSHYLDYDSARVRDRATCDAIEDLDADSIDSGDACGRHAIRGLLLTARRRGLAVTTLDLRNSGDTAGPRQQVVGYGSWSFTEPVY